MLYQPVPFLTTGEATVSYEAHQANGSELSAYTFSGVDLGTPAPDRMIVVFVSCGDREVDYVNLDGNRMLHTEGASNRMATLAWPTGTTGTIYVNMDTSPNFCAITVFAVYGASSAVAFDIDAKDESLDEDGELWVDVPANGCVIAHYSAHGARDDATVTINDGPTVRLNTTSDGRRVWAGSDNIAAGETRAHFDVNTISEQTFMTLVAFGPTPPLTDPSSLSASQLIA